MKISEFYTYAPKSKIKAGDANPEGCYQFFASSPDKHRRCDEAIYNSPAIIMGTGGGATIHYFDGEFSTSTDCLVLIPKDNINPKYLYYVFLGNLDYLKSGFHGAGLQHTSKAHIDNLEINNIPSLQTQEKIVELFDKLEKAISDKQKQLSRLDNIVKARFVEMFGDQRTSSLEIPKGTLKDVADIYLGLTHTPKYVNSGRPFLSVRDISSGVIDFLNCHYITEDEFNSLPKGARPKENDLLFCRVGTIGKPVIIPKGTPEFGTFVSVGFLRKKDNVLNTYLKAWMENEHFMEQVYQNIKGASQVNLNTGWLKEFEILIPSMEKQIKFDNFYKQVDKSKFAIQKSLEKTQQLFDSLMQEYFG